MHHRRTRRNFRFEAVESRLLLSAVPHLVKDLNLIPTRPVGHIENITRNVSDPSADADFVYFTAFDTIHGTELWRSDGTAAGTQIIKDINPGPNSAAPASLAVVGDQLYFTANDGVHGIELWTSDGTEAGTELVKNIRVPVDPTTEVPNPPDLSSSPASLTNVNGALFFIANDGFAGTELWTSDGSDNGTYMVADLNTIPDTTPGTTKGSSPSSLIAFGSQVIFRANDGVNGTELFVGNGSEAHLLTNINPAGGSSVSARYAAVINSAGYLYFTANDGSHGVELWRTLGTEATTELVSDVLAGSGSGIPSTPSLAADESGNVFFAASNGINGVEIWKTGNLGTSMVLDVFPGSGSSNPTSLTNVNNTIFFAANDGTQYVPNAGPDNHEEHGTELWMTDGNSSGTVLVKNIRPDPAPTAEKPTPATLNSNPSNFFVFNDQLYFQADDGEHGIELWTSDGSEDGTQMVDNIRPEASISDPHPSSPSSSPNSFVSANGLIFFQADDGEHGGELWTSDGTISELGDDDTTMVTDIYVGTDNLSIESNPSRFANVNGTLFFTGTFGNGSIALWRTNGTAAGTVMLHDFLGATGNPPLNLTAVGDVLYFSAWDPLHGYELWTSNGTVNGTVMVANIQKEAAPTQQVPVPPPLGSNPTNFFDFNGTLVFTANNGTTGNELWTTDGTEDGTRPISDIWVGSNSSNPSQFTLVDDTLFFVANDGTTGYELWKLSDVDNPAQRAKDVNPGIANGLDPNNSYLTNVDGTLYFRGTTAEDGSELWQSDSAGNASILADINPGTASSSPVFMTNLGGAVYFYANDGIHGNELWTSNGGGAAMVADINTTPGTPVGSDQTTLGSSDSSLFIAALGDKLIFTANDGIHGTELWVYNTNAAEPLPVKSTEINSSTGITYFARPIVYNDALYFITDDGVHGRELWSTDGTDANTNMVFDIRPGVVGAFDNNSPFIVIGTNLYFISNDGVHGAEVWHFDNSDSTAPVATATYDFEHGTIVLSFSEDVSASIEATDVKINLLPGGPTFSPDTFIYDTATNTATFSFTSLLANGNYHVSIAAADMTDESNNQLATGADFEFFVLNGDANRDRVVDAKDLGLLSGSWALSNKTYSNGDFNFDGKVDVKDLYILASNWQQTLAPYVPPVASVVSATRAPARRAPARAVELVLPTNMRS